MSANNPLIVALRKAVRDLCIAENSLGSVQSSYGYNSEAAKVEAAERKYETALKAVEEALGKES